MIDKSSIGKIIKNLRTNKKLTQEELAEKIDISKNYLSKVERGISVLNTEAFLKMAAVLDFSLEDFGVKTNNSVDENKKELIKKINESPQNKIKAYLELIKTVDNVTQYLK